MMETWALALLIVAAVVLTYLVAKTLVKVWARATYKRLLKQPQTEIDIDAFVGYDRNPVGAIKCVLVHKLQLGHRRASNKPIPIETIESTHVPGLRISRKRGSTTSTTGSDNATTTKAPVDVEKLIAESEKTPIVIATIRMGFGHHRLAYSVSSWAIQSGHPTIFHDLLSIKSGTLFDVSGFFVPTLTILIPDF